MANQNVEIQSFVQFSDFFLGDKFFALLGIPFLTKNKQKWRKFHFFLSQIFGVCLITLALLNPILSVEPLHFFVIVEDFGIFWIFGAILLKWSSLDVLFRPKITELLLDLEDFFPKNTRDQRTFQVWKYLAQTNKTCYLISFMALCLIFMHNWTPFLDMIYAEIVGKPHVFTPFLSIYYPFDALQHGFYEFSFIYVCWYCILTGTSVLASDFLFISSSQLIIMGLNNLKNSLAEIDLQDEETAMRELKKIIDDHQKYLKLIKNVGEINSFALFINLFGVMGVLVFFGFLSTVFNKF